MSNPGERVTADLLRRWGLPDPGDSKKSRGQVVVVGGSRRTPGAVRLAGEAALRVGAGRLAMLVPDSVDVQLAVAVPEAAVFALPRVASDPVEGGGEQALANADAILVGPGFDDPDETRETLSALRFDDDAVVVLDAFALGVLDDIPRSSLPAKLVLTPNEDEAAMLLGRDLRAERHADIAEIARSRNAVVACYGVVADARGGLWHVSEGGPGLGTSGSGDVRAGAIAGMAARGMPPERAAVWGTWAHARAGDRLTAHPGIGFLARDLPSALTISISEVIDARGG